MLAAGLIKLSPTTEKTTICPYCPSLGVIENIVSGSLFFFTTIYPVYLSPLVTT